MSTQRQSATPAAGAEPGGGRARGSRQRQRLIDACIAALHLYGPSRTTVEKVVAIADLSPGIVRFYFDSKDAMLLASLGYLAEEFEKKVLLPVGRLRDSPVRALELLVDLYLDPQIASTRKVSVWYSFWGEASSRQEYLDICGKNDDDFAVLVRQLMEGLIAESGARHLDADGVALGLIGVLEVLWQGFAFQSEENIDRAAARERSLAYLRSVFPGKFASRSAPVTDGRLPAWVYASEPLLALEREHLLGPARPVAGHTGQMQEFLVAANWKVLVEQWLESESPQRYFLSPNQLLDLTAGSAQLLQVVPEGPDRSRLMRFELRSGSGRTRKDASGRRGARPPLQRQIALAESTQQGLEASRPQTDGGAAVPAALAEFRRAVARLLPLLTQASDTRP
ncbi:MAG TPA: TetR family transcriptional regulator C-terminal domain-containing protein [Steroidobacteraceae bacterium]|nr:TetR family transcriptional regulator C-terminal domain-containing protein [Steroidobacteraceae bacterium]